MKYKAFLRAYEGVVVVGEYEMLDDCDRLTVEGYIEHINACPRAAQARADLQHDHPRAIIVAQMIYPQRSEP